MPRPSTHDGRGLQVGLDPGDGLPQDLGAIGGSDMAPGMLVQRGHGAVVAEDRDGMLRGGRAYHLVVRSLDREYRQPLDPIKLVAGNRLEAERTGHGDETGDRCALFDREYVAQVRSGREAEQVDPPDAVFLAEGGNTRRPALPRPPPCAPPCTTKDTRFRPMCNSIRGKMHPSPVGPARRDGRRRLPVS